MKKQVIKREITTKHTRNRIKRKPLLENEINNIPKQIAKKMDGNRRWAKQKKLDLRLGHKKGAETLENIVKEDKKKHQTIENSEEKNNKKNNRKEKNIISKPTPVITEIIDNNNVEETIENHE